MPLEPWKPATTGNRPVSSSRSIRSGVDPGDARSAVKAVGLDAGLRAGQADRREPLSWSAMTMSAAQTCSPWRAASPILAARGLRDLGRQGEQVIRGVAHRRDDDYPARPVGDVPAGGRRRGRCALALPGWMPPYLTTTSGDAGVSIGSPGTTARLMRSVSVSVSMAAMGREWYGRSRSRPRAGRRNPPVRPGGALGATSWQPPRQARKRQRRTPDGTPRLPERTP